MKTIDGKTQPASNLKVAKTMGKGYTLVAKDTGLSVNTAWRTKAAATKALRDYEKRSPDDPTDRDRAGKSGLRQYATNQRWLRGEISTQEHDAFARVSPGRRAYERDLMDTPRYHDGTLRPTWEQLSDIARDSWERNPTDRHTARSDTRLPPGTPDPRD